MASSPVTSFKDTFGSSDAKDHYNDQNDDDDDEDDNEDPYSPPKQKTM